MAKSQNDIHNKWRADTVNDLLEALKQRVLGKVFEEFSYLADTDDEKVDLLSALDDIQNILEDVEYDVHETLLLTDAEIDKKNEAVTLDFT